MTTPLNAAEVNAINTALNTSMTLAQANNLQTRLFNRDEQFRQVDSTYTNLLNAQVQIAGSYLAGSAIDAAFQKACYLIFDVYPNRLTQPTFARPA